MSTLAERLGAAAPPSKPNLTQWLDSLSDAERKLVEEAGRDWPISTLEKFIRSEGVAVSDVSLERWRATL